MGDGDLSDLFSQYSPHCTLSEPRKNLIVFQTPQLFSTTGHSYMLFPLLEKPFPPLPSGLHLFNLESPESLSLILREFPLPQTPQHAHVSLAFPGHVLVPSPPLSSPISLLPQPRRPKHPGGFLCVPSRLQGPVKAWPGQVSGDTQLGEVAMPRDPCCPLTRALV